ncbi:protein unc-13 homolog 4B-like [Planococcus citri]|uniref:protein unc-13 homolog 4B-like n=1 Tax=Planococcus citri TaxID=170843 RepID=UPI0031F82839
MEKTNNELDCVILQGTNTEEKNKLNIIRRKLLKSTDFLRTGYRNRQRKKVAPLITTSKQSELIRKTKMKNKIKLERKKAINTENVQLLVQNESRDDSSEEEDDWDSSSNSNVEYEIEQLFREVYQRCINLVGQDINNKIGRNTIVSYLKRAFEYSDHRSEMLIRDSQNKQYPKSILKVNVLKTRDVLPKDVFSVGDLFFIIWISSDPSKYYTGKITKTKVNPNKDQTFKLPFSSSAKDVLHLELRDIIPSEDKSIEESERISEPIGSAQIMLKDIFSAGQTKWITLQRPSQSTGFGKIQLRMMFSSEENVKLAFERHRCLLKILFRRLLIERNDNLNGWKGTFSPEAELILKQHFIQSNLTSQDDLFAKWAAYIDVIDSESVNFDTFDILLDDLLLTCDINSTTKQKKRYFWNAVKKLMPLCYEHVKNFRKAGLNEKETFGKLYAILSILHNISNCKIPANLNLFPSELYTWIENTKRLTFQTVLHEAVVQGACEWFEFLVNDNSPGNDSDEAKLTQMNKVAEAVVQDLEDGMDFHGIFAKKQIVSFCKTIFCVYEEKITEMMETSVPKICQGIKQLNLTECYRGNMDYNSCSLGSLTCDLFFKIQKFHKIGADIFSIDVDTLEKFPSRKLFHKWFLSAVNTWLDIVILRSMRKIEDAVEMEYFVPVDEMVLHSSSADDVLNVVYQVKKFWDQLEWPDVKDSYFFLVKIIQDVSAAVMHYADLTINKINSGDKETKTYSINDWCVAIINVDFVFHEIRPLASELGADKLLHSLSDYSSMTAADRCQRTLDEMIKNSFEGINKKIINLLETFSKKMEPSIERFLQEGAELLHQQPKVIDYLKEFLDENLINLNSKLNSEIFHHLLDMLWEQISEILDRLIENGEEKKQPTSYFLNLKETLHILIGFFKIEEKVPEEEIEKLRGILAKNERRLTLLSTNTARLMHMYHMERWQEQEQLEDAKNGILTVEVQIEGDNLNIEILGASNVIPMDSNGQSDPYVRVELLPLHKFSFFSYKTKILKKTLYPVFEEKFTVPLTKDQLGLNNALIKFIVKDHDLCKNRYMADAFIRLTDVIGTSQPKLYNLKLNRPNPENDILKLLDARKINDKLARIFLKKEKSRV